MDEDQLKLDAFKKAALSQGYAQEEVEAFATMAQAGQQAKMSEASNYVNMVKSGMPFEDVPEAYKSKVFTQLQSAGDYFTTGQPPTEISTSTATGTNIFETAAEKKTKQIADAQVKSYGAIQKPTQEQWDKLEPIAQSMLIDKGIKPPIAEEADKNRNKIINVANDLFTRDTNRITGWYGKVPILPDDPAQRTKALYKQLKGAVSLENRKLLKGSGQISDYEMQILADASTALNTNLSNEDFRAVLTKLITEFGGQLPEISADKVVGGLPETPPKQITVEEIIGKGKEALGAGLGPIGQVVLGTQGSKAIPGGMKNLIKETTTGIKEQITGEKPMKTMTVKDVLTSAGGPLAELLLNSKSEMVKIAAPASADVLSIILLPEVLKWGTDKVVGKLSQYVDTKTISNLRKAKAQAYNNKIDTTPIQEALEKYVSPTGSVRPSDLEESAKLLKITQKMFVNKKMTIEQLLNKAVEANKAFTKAGTVRSAAADSFDAETGRIIKEILKKAAPDVAKLTDQLRFLYQVPKTIKTGLNMLKLPATIASTIGTGAYLGSKFQKSQ